MAITIRDEAVLAGEIKARMYNIGGLTVFKGKELKRPFTVLVGGLALTRTVETNELAIVVDVATSTANSTYGYKGVAVYLAIGLMMAHYATYAEERKYIAELMDAIRDPVI